MANILKPSKVITVVGLNSGKELQINLELLSMMLDTYIKDTPRENRSTEKMINIVRFHDEISALMNAEYNAAEEKIQRSLEEAEVKDIKHTEYRTELTGDRYKEFIDKAFGGI